MTALVYMGLYDVAGKIIEKTHSETQVESGVEKYTHTPDYEVNGLFLQACRKYGG